MNFGFHQYADQMTVHPLGLVLLGIAIIWLCISKRQKLIWPVLFLCCFISPAQRIVVGGVDFSFLRILMSIAMVHLTLTGAWAYYRVHLIDKLFIFSACLPILLCLARGQTNMLMFHIGTGGDVVFCYLFARLTIRSLEDIRSFATAAAVISIPVAFMFLIEYLTQRNPFAIFGGVQEVTRMRSGKLRCQGSFSHPIIAGLWWVTLLPVIVSLWWFRFKTPLSGVLAIVGGICAFAIILFANSSTSTSTVLLLIIMVLLYGVRRSFGYLAWVVLGSVILLHVVSQSGFHHLLFARFSVVAGGTGYHRFRLYDAAMDQFGTWFLIGQSSTRDWGWHLEDVTSELVSSALYGGLLGLILYVTFLTWSIRTAWKVVLSSEHAPQLKFTAYAIGMSMLALAVNGLGVSYFGQADFLFPYLLGVVPVLQKLSGTSGIASTSKAVPRRNLKRPGPSQFKTRGEPA